MRRDRGRRPRKKVCVFCQEKTDYIDYKQAEKLKKFITERGKILPRRITGNCAKHQREMTVAIKRARIVALLPFTSKAVKFFRENRGYDAMSLQRWHRVFLSSPSTLREEKTVRLKK